MNGYSLNEAFDKINIYVPGELYEILERDVAMFEIYGKDQRTPNRNRFLNMLVQGYYDSFVEENKTLHGNIISALKGNSVDRCGKG